MAKIVVAVQQIEERKRLAQALEAMGHFVIKAGSGSVTLEILNANPECDLLIIDIDLPDIPAGRELSRLLREQPAFRQMPFIILASNTVFDQEDELIALGPSYFVRKPVECTQLKSTVLKILGRTAG